MGWLFGRKKVPKVPFPEPQQSGSDTLRFPEQARNRAIEPEEIMSAAGFKDENAEPLPEQEDESLEPEAADDESEDSSDSERASYPRVPAPITSEPLYVKVDVYQRILGEIGNLKELLSELSKTNSGLENSEYNEEANFDKLRRAMKVMHDRLLQADKTLFKS